LAHPLFGSSFSLIIWSSKKLVNPAYFHRQRYEQRQGIRLFCAAREKEKAPGKLSEPGACYLMKA